MKKVLVVFLSLIAHVAFSNCIDGDCKNGHGTFQYSTSATYTGYFKSGLPHGLGELASQDGGYFKGIWRAGKRSGYGLYEFPSGDQYTGYFINDEFSGLGLYSFRSGETYFGFFKNDKSYGKGVLKKPNGELLAGFWDNGKLHKKVNLSTNQIAKFLGYAADTNPHFTKQIKATGLLTGGPSPKATRQKISKPKKYTASRPKKRPQTAPATNNPVDIHAFIVGVGSYQKFRSLKYTDDDAYRMYAFLKSPEGGALPDENIKILIDDDASKQKIMAGLEELRQRTDDNDIIICYMSGHGIKGSFLPVDSDGYQNLLPYTEFISAIEGCASKQKVVIVDACFSGSMLDHKRPMLQQLDQFYNKMELSPGGTALLLSSKTQEYSVESSGMRQGVFSHFIINGLKGAADKNSDRLVAIGELFQYVQREVSLYTNRAQNPIMTGNIVAETPLAWVR